MKKAENFENIVKNIFAPIYPVIAQQIVDRVKKTDGICVDVGCGTGALAIAMSKISDFEFIFFDKSQDMLDIARENIYRNTIEKKSKIIAGDIHNIPISSNFADLIISRGSSPFWDDWNLAYSEIVRVLKPNSDAYIGGGFGNKELRDSITAQMNKNNSSWRDSFKDKAAKERERLPEILNSLPIKSYDIINDESGFWVHIIKGGV